ncbi:hypothetical protein DIC66_20770 [Rhodoferax lacus]|uniref:Uncharacterized protein n=1 Tax=Rhodoferax lacus TaxID=2184758 RepID=A0A3E1R7I6_9BURK|nr:hypothetical protein [Rhodoferax lacus]RFO95002.1 hypothetical protein DIC66_20770 [Rhodoferax lacus]
MQAVTVTPAAIEAFQSFYLAELDGRVQRSEVVGAITLKKGSAALFFEPTEGKFTLVEKMPDVEAANVFDCVPREQWGRTVMLFGHATNTGGYIASGHATLDGNTIKIKLASGHYYRLEVDPTLPHLQPFVSAEPLKPKESAPRPEKKSPARASKNSVRPFEKPARAPGQGQEQESSNAYGDDESEDLTEEDLRRLRGELPLNTSAKKKWKR